MVMKWGWGLLIAGFCLQGFVAAGGQAATPRSSDQTVGCDVLVIGGGLAGVATAYEALKAGQEVCLTELTDWIGGQVSSQGTSALDERKTQRDQLIFPKGYLELRQRILDRYPIKTPGNCWVSLVCFLPQDGHEILLDMLKQAAKTGKGTLHLFLNTAVKDLDIAPIGSGQQILSVQAIQHFPAPGAPPLNTYPLSQTIADSYSEQNSDRFHKTIIHFTPTPSRQSSSSPPWYVIEATETGEILALADVPYRLGIDPRNFDEPSASETTVYPYCPQAFTYTFAIEATATPQTPTMPSFYPQFANAYSYNSIDYAKNPELVFTYRRILSTKPVAGSRTVNPGDISMQNWNWGNDYGPGTAEDNWLYTRSQLAEQGQLSPGGWQGGYRISSLQRGEEQALGFFYWMVAGEKDAKLPLKLPFPNLRYLNGYKSPMGTAHGLSKFPYIREGRRVIGRPAYGYPNGFTIHEIAVSRKNYQEPFYQDPNNLSTETYNRLAAAMAGLRAIDVIQGNLSPAAMQWRTRARLYPDSVGIGNYNIDFHPCMASTPAEAPGNQERPLERQAAEQTYPFQIPLRAMIPQKLDNLLVTGKNIATTHITNAAYRVHAIEWSAGAAAGTTAAYALKTGIMPYQMVDNLPSVNLYLEDLQRHLTANGNPIAFPGMSILNQDWHHWQ
ncbi:FAD-dependent oxidoreductase [Pantanalinema sp. GBBB05]|uniref:FAD-dependent oxidoreductase n=1 Tax=Pantanalinema sp. GBBB05 TaxID=2604139 RepID=UPI001DC34201|nr:FAD-dependent oxidoreductase [Pantanalinema sp. GBBB05]